MVFSLFGRGKAVPPAADVAAPTQLRTPSPSASASAATVPPQSPEIAPLDANRGLKRSRSASPNPTTGHTTGEIHMPPTDPADLLALFKKIPPKTLHSYVIAHIPNASPQEIASLTEFFATLAPPPKLHCVRCHKEFVEVENTDRSCLVPHDDESAEVEYVGNSKSKVAGVVGTTYETLWGCCNKVVEGDGDQGPPDGWCYEGFHTTDVKRARFRADSTPQNDKLTSCRRLRCFNSDIAGDSHGRSQRAAARKSLKEESDEEEYYDVRELEREAHALAVDSDAEGSSKKKASKSQKRKSDAMEVEEESASAAISKPKGKGKAESMKPKSAVKSNSTIVASPAPSSPSVSEAGDVSMAAPSGELEEEVKPKPRKPRKSRKSAAMDGGKYVPPKDVEESSDNEEDERPKRKKARRKSTAAKVAAT